MGRVGVFGIALLGFADWADAEAAFPSGTWGNNAECRWSEEWRQDDIATEDTLSRIEGSERLAGVLRLELVCEHVGESYAQTRIVLRDGPDVIWVWYGPGTEPVRRTRCAP